MIGKLKANLSLQKKKKIKIITDFDFSLLVWFINWIPDFVELQL